MDIDQFVWRRHRRVEAVVGWCQWTRAVTPCTSACEPASLCRVCTVKQYAPCATLSETHPCCHTSRLSVVWHRSPHGGYGWHQGALVVVVSSTWQGTGGCQTVNRVEGGSIPPAAILKLRQFRSPHICLCLSEETLKASGPFYLVSMPREEWVHMWLYGFICDSMGSYVRLWVHMWLYGIICKTVGSYVTVFICETVCSYVTLCVHLWDCSYVTLWVHMWLYGFICDSMGSYVTLWVHMWLCGFICDSMGSYVTLWVHMWVWVHMWDGGFTFDSMGSYVTLWVHMWLYGFICDSVGSYVTLWDHL